MKHFFSEIFSNFRICATRASCFHVERSECLLFVILVEVFCRMNYRVEEWISVELNAHGKQIQAVLPCVECFVPATVQKDACLIYLEQIAERLFIPCPTQGCELY
jgi:hypothetical protein